MMIDFNSDELHFIGSMILSLEKIIGSNEKTEDNEKILGVCNQILTKINDEFDKMDVKNDSIT